MGEADIQLKIAEEMLGDAKLLYEQKRFRSAASRAYYAIFHAAKALLNQVGHNCQSHGGAISRFGQYIVNAGLMDKDFSKFLGRAYNLREKSDYGLLFEGIEEEVGRVVSDAEKFVAEAIKILHQLKSNLK